MPALDPAGLSRGEERRRQLDAALATLDHQVRSLRSGADWERVLHEAARMPGQSFANVLLIAAQRPGATRVAGYEAWKATGRPVSRGEKGIAVLAPHGGPAAGGGAAGLPAAASARAGLMRLAFVWDIGQTAGGQAEVTAPRLSPGGLLDALMLAARREGFAVEREHCAGADSLTLWAVRRIRVRPGLDPNQEAQAILHQLGHVLMHRDLPEQPCGTNAGCAGAIRIEADSAACLIAARYGITTPTAFPPVACWAGSDPRAQPARTILAAGARITSAASVLSAHLAAILAPAPPAGLSPAPHSRRPAGDRAADAAVRTAAIRDRAEATLAAASQPPESPPICRSLVLEDAERFFLAQAAGSWVPGYARSRGLTSDTIRTWRIGYAPAGWTALTDHLRSLGHHRHAIESAGLARRSVRGTLIDHFRDRAMLAVTDEHGTIAGFIGRARPGAGPGTPKYLNSPQTATYAKGDLLLGVHQARPALAAGAVPVLVEGPFDAIAVSACDPARYAGLAACGTALTARQLAALNRLCDLRERGVIVAADGDPAGRNAAVRAYRVIRAFTTRSAWVSLPAGQDPADVYQSDPAALAVMLRGQAQPLARLPVDELIDRWLAREYPAARLMGMRAAADLIAELLPESAAEGVLAVTGGRQLNVLTADLRPVAEPAATGIAAVLTAAGTACQVAAAGDRLGFDYSDVITEVANAVTSRAGAPKRIAARDRRGDLLRTGITRDAPALAAVSFPHRTLTTMRAGRRAAAAAHSPPLSPRAPRCPM